MDVPVGSNSIELQVAGVVVDGRNLGEEFLGAHGGPSAFGLPRMGVAGAGAPAGVQLAVGAAGEDPGSPVGVEAQGGRAGGDPAQAGRGGPGPTALHLVANHDRAMARAV